MPCYMYVTISEEVPGGDVERFPNGFDATG